MLSFEDFFIKKKIDLPALKCADRSLYDEFQIHYLAMGEKSFDHTKKFWFNRLRKQYFLAEIPVAKNIVTESKNDVDLNNNVADTLTKKPVGFKPKFKKQLITSNSSIDDTSTIQSTDMLSEGKTPELPTKPSGFKPRFKAGVTKTAETNTILEENNKALENSASAEKAKSKEAITKPSGFKPRFKADVTKTAETNTILEENNALENSASAEKAKSEEATTKPSGFKPRFKAGVTKTAETNTILEENIALENSASAEKAKTEEATTKPSGFKPRFKAGITKAQNSQGEI